MRDSGGRRGDAEEAVIAWSSVGRKGRAALRKLDIHVVHVLEEHAVQLLSSVWLSRSDILMGQALASRPRSPIYHPTACNHSSWIPRRVCFIMRQFASTQKRFLRDTWNTWSRVDYRQLGRRIQINQSFVGCR